MRVSPEVSYHLVQCGDGSYRKTQVWTSDNRPADFRLVLQKRHRPLTNGYTATRLNALIAALRAMHHGCVPFDQIIMESHDEDESVYHDTVRRIVSMPSMMSSHADVSPPDLTAATGTDGLYGPREAAATDTHLPPLRELLMMAGDISDHDLRQTFIDLALAAHSHTPAERVSIS